MRVRDIILPEDRLFLDLFDQMATNIAQAADLLAEQCVDLTSNQSNCLKIRHLEHDSDDVARKIYGRLEESLITPLEPEEISRLVKALDDVIDIIDWVSHQICNYRIRTHSRDLKEFTEYISISAHEIVKGVLGLHDLHNPESTREIKRTTEIINVNWNESSDLLSRAVSELFETNDTLMILKLKDVFENLEEVLQECNDVGHVLNEIVLRRS